MHLKAVYWEAVKGHSLLQALYLLIPLSALQQYLWLKYLAFRISI